MKVAKSQRKFERGKPTVTESVKWEPMCSVRAETRNQVARPQLGPVLGDSDFAALCMSTDDPKGAMSLKTEYTNNF